MKKFKIIYILSILAATDSMADFDLCDRERIQQDAAAEVTTSIGSDEYPQALAKAVNQLMEARGCENSERAKYSGHIYIPH